MEKNIQERKSNLELLRVISMILIILHHYSVHGGLLNNAGTYMNKYIGAIIYTGGKIGVNIFILISGYFLINSKFKIKKILKLIFQVFCYSVAIYILYILVTKNFINVILKNVLFPITYSSYWFITTYLGLYIIFPFINSFIKNISQENLKKLLTILFVMFSLIPTFTETTSYMGNFQWFVYIYMIGAYIKLYGINKIKMPHLKWWGIGNYAVLILMCCLHIYCRNVYKINIFKLNRIIDVNFVFPFFISIFMFLWFENLNIKNNKFINLLGKTSFAVYLIHDNIFREEFWRYVFWTPAFYSANLALLILHIVYSVVAIYFWGTIIECIRVKVLEEPIFKIKKFDKWFNNVDKLMNIE